MSQRIKKRYIALWMSLLFLLCAGGAYAATYAQGYTVGCEIAQGVYSFPNDWRLRDRTVNLAWNSGEFEYALGVQAGYTACATGHPQDPPGPPQDPIPDEDPDEDGPIP